MFTLGPLSSLRPLPRRTRPAHRRTGLSRRSRKRLFGLLGVFGVAFSLIAYRLVSIQAFDNSGYQQVSDTPVRTVVLPGLRGSILASNGNELALSEMRPTIFADPGEITDAATEAVKLAPVLGQSAFKLQAELTAKTTYVALVTGATNAMGTAVTNLGLAGIGTKDEPIRYYPDGSLAGPIIGQVNAAGQGVGGLEQGYNSVLAGRSGKLTESVDPQGRPIAGSITANDPAVNGSDILSTIDQPLEYQTEQILAKALTAAGGKDAVAIVEDTKTGAILAAANMVAGRHGAVQAASGLAFTQVYEPGSVSKIITMSAGLALGKINPSSKIPIPYPYYVAGTAFHDDAPHPFEQLKPMGILTQSSNIGAIHVAQRIGPDALYRYLSSYGLTQKTDINFPGESQGLVPTPSKFSGTTLATLSFGQGYGVTAAQMVSAVNTVANGGEYVAPKLVSATVGADGRQRLVSTPKPHRVVPTSVVKKLTPMLEQVVSNGTGTAAKIPGYAVAGKTGTANFAAHGGYVQNRYVSSFAGYAPAQKPAITALVVIDNTAGYGATAAAPAFSQIVKDALVDKGVPSAGKQPAPNINSVPIIGGQPQKAYLGQ